MSGSICTECAGTAPIRTIDECVFLHLSAYIPQTLDIAAIAGRLLAWRGRDRKKNARRRRSMVLHGTGGQRAKRMSQIRA